MVASLILRGGRGGEEEEEEEEEHHLTNSFPFPSSLPPSPHSDLRRLPLAAIAASLSALKGYEQGIDFENLDGSSNKENGKKGAMALDRAGYESVSGCGFCFGEGG